VSNERTAYGSCSTDKKCLLLLLGEMKNGSANSSSVNAVNALLLLDVIISIIVKGSSKNGLFQ
jgi:hypothetical protein